MAIKSSIDIKPCNTKSSEAHNRRTAEYMRNIGESRAVSGIRPLSHTSPASLSASQDGNTAFWQSR